MATILSIEDLSKTFITDLIFSGVTFQIQEREHVAVVGINGSGKSTLLKIIAGLEEPDSGRVMHRSGLRITYLAQEARFDGVQTVREAALAAFERAHEVERSLNDVESRMASATGAKLDELITRQEELRLEFEHLGGYEMDHRTDQVLSGLGFAETEWSWQARHLSGGQKTRLALAQALLGDPDLLLLDEPTNHLDLATLEWLEGFLKSWNRAFMVVSHDRYFLDQVTTRTLEMNFGRLDDYPASYNRFLKLREERRRREWVEYEAQQEYIRQTEEFIRKYKAGQRSKEARGRETRLARLERLERPQEHKTLNARLPSAARSGRVVLSTKPLKIGFKSSRQTAQETVLLQTNELEIERENRVALIGPNGGGKTTFLRTLLGEIPPLSGTFNFGTNVKPAYYAQGHEGLDLDKSVLRTIRDARPMEEGAARTLLGRFLFSDDDVFKPVSALSGGERSRLALAKLTLEEANFLILDEPTNHLDIESREALEELLKTYDGTILFVSHDRYFIDQIATHVWVIQDHRLHIHLGNYSDYARRLANQSTHSPATMPERVSEREKQSSERRGQRISDKELRNASQRVRALEREIATLEQRLNALSAELAQATESGDVEHIAALGESYEQTQDHLDAVYEEWTEKSEQLAIHMEAAGRER
jgi:ATP-binding cassette, subfamily F, member 3